MFAAILSKVAGKVAGKVPETIGAISKGKTQRMTSLRGWASPIIYLLCAMPFVLLLWAWLVFSLFFPQYEHVSEKAVIIVNTIGAKFFFSIITGLLFGTVTGGALLAKKKMEIENVKHEREQETIKEINKKEVGYDFAFDHVIKNEGGYADIPEDRGGETYKGISRKWFKSWRGWKIIDRLKRRIRFKERLEKSNELQSLVKEFYYNEFWEKTKCDEILKLSNIIANEVFDTAVNCGRKQAIKFLQQAINLCGYQKINPIKEDGIIGTGTLDTLDTLLPKYEKAVNAACNYYQAKHYVSLCDKKPSQKKFIRGWLGRTEVITHKT